MDPPHELKRTKFITVWFVFRFNVMELAKRNKHRVAVDQIERKIKGYERILPLYFGWFLNGTDSRDLLERGGHYFKQCQAAFPAFISVIRENAGGIGKATYCTILEIAEIEFWFTNTSFMVREGIVHKSLWVGQWIFTARIRRVREGNRNRFSLFLCPHLGGGGFTPSPSHNTSTGLMSFTGGYPISTP